MQVPSKETVEKTVFVISLCVLTFLYGYGARTYNLFPDDWLMAAWQQGRTAVIKYQQEDLGEPVYAEKGIVVNQQDKVHQPGAILTRFASEGVDLGLALMNMRGKNLHVWSLNREKLASIFDNFPAKEQGVPSLHGGSMLPNGDLVLNISHIGKGVLDYQGAVRVNSCGKILWSLQENTHHSVNITDRGTFWMPSTSDEPIKGSEEYPDGHPGLDEPVYQEYMLHVSSDGEVLDRINVLDVIYNNELARYIAKLQEWRGSDILGYTDVAHMNEVDPLPEQLADDFPLFEAGDLMVSLRNLDLVFVVDPETQNVKWHAADPFLRQHDPDWMKGGWVGVFDNNWDGTKRGSILGGSRLIALQPHTDSTRVLFPTEQFQRGPFYTKNGGRWEKLDNGNLHIYEQHPRRIIEVDSTGQVVWDWRLPSNKSGFGFRYELSADDVKEWPCNPL